MAKFSSSGKYLEFTGRTRWRVGAGIGELIELSAPLQTTAPSLFRAPLVAPSVCRILSGDRSHSNLGDGFECVLSFALRQMVKAEVPRQAGQRMRRRQEPPFAAVPA
jgi:hypothetical protein